MGSRRKARRVEREGSAGSDLKHGRKMRGRILKWMNDLTCLFVYYHQQIMPIREGKAKLWFNTKEQQVLPTLI